MQLSEAVRIYLRLKGQNRPVTFHRAAERACGYVIDVCGDKDLLNYTKADATRFGDNLIERGLAGSRMTRVFGIVRSAVARLFGDCVEAELAAVIDAERQEIGSELVAKGDTGRTRVGSA